MGVSGTLVVRGPLCVSSTLETHKSDDCVCLYAPPVCSQKQQLLFLDCARVLHDHHYHHHFFTANHQVDQPRVLCSLQTPFRVRARASREILFPLITAEVIRRRIGPARLELAFVLTNIFSSKRESTKRKQ